MLQITQGMYFRAVPLTDTTHRAVLFTNLRSFGDTPCHDLMFGRILPSTGLSPHVGTVTIEARERLETVTETGSPEALMVTTGQQQIDEIAAVLAFCTNSVCVRDHDRARRLIARRGSDGQMVGEAATILRQTFDPMIVLRDEAITDLNRFLHALVGLERDLYVAAMRAIRQVVDAMLMVGEDATLAYTLMVAAMESLGQTSVEPGEWATYDPTKRDRIDNAIGGLGEARQERIRTAILANEHVGLQRRFVAFVLGHVEPSFYREEALDALRPVTATQLPGALAHAYAIRSRNVHTLANLASEVWMHSDRADTAHVEGATLLSLEGLARLARHVVRRFVERGAKGVTANFNYRSALPGLMRAQLAPQYWVHQAGGFNEKTAPGFLAGFIEILIECLAKPEQTALPNMSGVLDIIERKALGQARRSDRLAMAGIMALWNACAPEEHIRQLKPKLEQSLTQDLAEPSIVSFAVSMLLGVNPDWPPEAYPALALQRTRDLQGKRPQPMPKRIDAALHLAVANVLFAQGSFEEAMAAVSRAVETVPGLRELIAFEKALAAGDRPLLRAQAFVLGQDDFVSWPKQDELPPPTP